MSLLWRSLLLLLLICLVRPLPLAVAAAVPTVAATAPPMVADRLVVGLGRADGLTSLGQLVPQLMLSRLFAPYARTITPLGDGLYRLELTATTERDQARAALLTLPGLRFVEPDYLLEALELPGPNAFGGQPNDPSWSGQEEMRLIEADRGWTVTTGTSEVVIAMLDSGVLASHVDLAGKLLPGFDFVNGRPGAVDDQGHGTFTAALAAGVGNNGGGMAGVCWGCRILPVKILNRDGRGPASAFVQAIRYAVDNGAQLINVSAGTPAYSEAMREAVDYAYSRKVLVVAAAGNRPEARENYPAAFERALAVAASGPTDQVAAFSTYGSFVDIAAPGVNIMSASLAGNDRVRRDSGTSAASPLVTGALGLLLSLRPDLSVDGLTQLLLDTAVDIGPPGRDDFSGAGRLSVADTLLAAARPVPAGGAQVRVSEVDSSYRFRLSATGFAPGEELRAWATGPDGRHLPLRGLAANGRGTLDTPAQLTGNVQAGPHQLTLFGDQSRRTALTMLTVALPNPAPFFQPVAPMPSTAARLYFPETQHTLSGGFKGFWERSGGLAIFGFPISEEFREVNPIDGRTYIVQYFERNRFEYHPDQRGTPYEVQLGLLGVQLTGDRVFLPGEPGAETPTRRYFAATRHSLSGDFLAYWESSGGLAIFGYPISEPFEEEGRLVQYFERNRFELHPENPPAQRVLLGLLGSALAQRNGYR